jgi:uroporphyrinogen-III decarboxylase
MIMNCKCTGDSMETLIKSVWYDGMKVLKVTNVKEPHKELENLTLLQGN